MTNLFTRMRLGGNIMKPAKLDCICTAFQQKLILRQFNTDSKEDRPKDPALRFFKWGYKPLPTQTVFDKPDHQFSVHSPEFKLPKRQGRLSKKLWRQRIAELQEARNDPKLEKLARNRKLYVDLDVIQEEWRQEFGLLDLNKLSSFYGINRDIFNREDFVVKTWLDVTFNDIRIHRGNFVQPNQLLSPPSNITYSCSKDDLHSIIVVNLDGHPLDNKKEIVHWMICNIPGNSVSDGTNIYDYLPPAPFKGTGANRLVLLLCQQPGKLELDTISGESQMSVASRTLLTSQFISSHKLKPVGLSWCQVEWDESVSETCRRFSDLSSEPVFDWEVYTPPKEEAKELNRALNELSYRNM